MKKIIILAVTAFALMALIVGANQDSELGKNNIDPTPVAKVTTTEARVAPAPTTAEARFTRSQENAIGSAESYLSFTAFSRAGLIDQLEFEGYSTADATLAVDHLNVNWNEQAWESAESYLDFTSFSRSGLLGQLEFEGFTSEQAIYGVNKTGL